MLDIYKAIFPIICKIKTKFVQLTTWVVHINFAFKNEEIYPLHFIREHLCQMTVTSKFPIKSTLSSCFEKCGFGFKQLYVAERQVHFTTLYII